MVYKNIVNSSFKELLIRTTSAHDHKSMTLRVVYLYNLDLMSA